MEQETGRIPPNVLFISFSIIAGSYILSVVLMMLQMATASYLFFPETAEFLSTPDLPPEELAANAELAFPQNLFWILLATHSLVCVGLGWLVARFSPLAKFNHTVFLAVILFVSLLQMAVKSPSEIQWMFLVLMVAYPIAIMIGGRLHLRS